MLGKVIFVLQMLKHVCEQEVKNLANHLIKKHWCEDSEVDSVIVAINDRKNKPGKC